MYKPLVGLPEYMNAGSPIVSQSVTCHFFLYQNRVLPVHVVTQVTMEAQVCLETEVHL